MICQRKKQFLEGSLCNDKKSFASDGFLPTPKESSQGAHSGGGRGARLRQTRLSGRLSGGVKPSDAGTDDNLSVCLI